MELVVVPEGAYNMSCYSVITNTSIPYNGNYNNYNYNNYDNDGDGSSVGGHHGDIIQQTLCCIDTYINFNNCTGNDPNDNTIIKTTTTSITTAANTNGTMPVLRHPVPYIVFISVMYSITFLAALLGNIAIVSMVIKDRRFRSATYILIMNLSIADLIMTIVCHPVNLIISIQTRWLFGAFMCKAVPFLQGVAVCASVNTLVVIAVDRYVAICHVMRPRNTKCITRIILIIIWIVAITLMTPWALYYKLDQMVDGPNKIDYCYEDFPEPHHRQAFFLGVIFLTCYALPLLFIVVCYVLIGYRVWHRDAPGITSSKGVIEKSKIRVVKMLVVVVFLFTFSWLPLYIIQLLRLFAPSMLDIVVLSYVVPIAQWLGTSNSCMNPLVYCLFSQKIRRRIKAMICCTKQELRTLYSNRSVYSSVVQVNRRDSNIRRDSSMVNGSGGLSGYAQHQHYAAGSVYDHRNHVKPAGRCDQNELSTFHSRNGVKSTHV